MDKIDLKKRLKDLYTASSREPAIVDVSEMMFLMVDGSGDPNTSPDYQDAIKALYAISYTLKFIVKKGRQAIDYSVMPLEGLWWVEDTSKFSMADKSAWSWTAMIMQPEYVTSELVSIALADVKNKEDLAILPKMRFESLREGLSAQIMHIGPYATEEATIQRLHRFIEQTGHSLRGKHHEIYLSDHRRTAPENLKTIIRQPII